jgi:drug/metabolite transporter (DMT)-like permease
MIKEKMSPAEARAALASVDAAREQLAALGNCPPWRHAAFGAVMGLLVGGVGFDLPVQTATTVLALGGVTMIATNDRKRYGVFVNGFRKGATLPITIALVAVMLGLLLAQIWLREHHAAAPVHLAIGLAAFAIGIAASVAWNRIFRREMERGA